jgi:rod shape-determining protein MreC
MPSFEPDIEDSRGRRGLWISGTFVALSALLLALPPVAQERVSSVLRASVLAPFLRIQDSLLGMRVLSQSLDGLQSQLDSAQAELQSRRTLEEENQRLRDLLALRQRNVSSFIPASAIRSGTLGSESMFLLDVGRRDGVEVNDPVVVSGGLVGMVREVSARSSLAMDWTHPDFRASAMTSDGSVFGIVESRRGAFREEDRLMFNGIPYQAAVRTGLPVVTSGRGAVYPRGIPIGTIAESAEIEAGWRRSYWLEPAIRPGSATHVLVLTGDRYLEEELLEGLSVPSGEGPPPGP